MSNLHHHQNKSSCRIYQQLFAYADNKSSGCRAISGSVALKDIRKLKLVKERIKNMTIISAAAQDVFDALQQTHMMQEESLKLLFPEGRPEDPNLVMSLDYEAPHPLLARERLPSRILIGVKHSGTVGARISVSGWRSKTGQEKSSCLTPGTHPYVCDASAVRLTTILFGVFLGEEKIEEDTSKITKIYI